VGPLSGAVPARRGEIDVLFGKRKPRLSLEQTLAARPLRLVDAQASEREDGGINLRVPLRQMRFGWLLRVPRGASKTFELDEMGRLVWDHCDGRTTVQQMIRKLSRHYNLNLREAQVATITFLNILTRKGLVGMAVKKQR
jgi:hypothetical protein